MKPHFLFLVSIPLLLTGCISSGDGWTSSNHPGYGGKAGPDGELVLANVAAHDGSDSQVASLKSSDNPHNYHRDDQAKSHGYAGGKSTPSKKNTQYAGISSDSHPSGRSSGAVVSTEAMQGATQK